jgi:hypothetical protein
VFQLVKCICKWYQQSQETGNVLKRHLPGRPSTSQDDIERIVDALQRSPKHSVQHASRQVQVPKSTERDVVQRRQTTCAQCSTCATHPASPQAPKNKRCNVRAHVFFFTAATTLCAVVSPRPTVILKDQGLHFVGPLPFDLSGMVAVPGAYAPASINLRFTVTREPLYCKVIIAKENSALQLIVISREFFLR